MKRWLLIALVAMCLCACSGRAETTYNYSKTVIIPVSAPEPELKCKSAVLMDYETGTVLYSKDPLVSIAPASMAKLMTTYLLVEKIKAGEYTLDDKITIPPEADFRQAPPQSSLAFLEAGTKVTLSHLLTGLMVCSGNDAAVAVAKLIAGSTAGCVEAMNSKAQELGFTSFNFVDPAGYYDGNSVNALEFCQFCCLYIRNCYDIMSPIINAPKFASYNTTQRNSNDLLRTFPGIDGMKTGHVDESGYNIALTAERNGMRLVAVIMGLDAKSTTDGRLMRMSDGASLLTYGFSAFKTLPVQLPADFSAPVSGCAQETVPVALKNGGKICVPYGWIADLSLRIKLDGGRKGAVSKGDRLGSCAVCIGQDILTEYELIATSDVGQASSLKLLFAPKTKELNFSLAFPR